MTRELLQTGYERAHGILLMMYRCDLNKYDFRARNSTYLKSDVVSFFSSSLLQNHADVLYFIVNQHAAFVQLYRIHTHPYMRTHPLNIHIVNYTSKLRI